MAGLRYLIVDDSPTVRLTIRQALRQESTPNQSVAEADSAQSAITKFDAEHPDVVFLDIDLTRVDPSTLDSGRTLDLLHPAAQTDREAPNVARYMLAKNAKLKIVVCTGNTPDDSRVRELIKLGAFHILSKPVHLAQIREVLKDVRAEHDQMVEDADEASADSYGRGF
jgi:CheY-like chemotaxis protein